MLFVSPSPNKPFVSVQGHGVFSGCPNSVVTSLFAADSGESAHLSRWDIALEIYSISLRCLRRLSAFMLFLDACL